MKSGTHNIDVEMQEWLSAEEDGLALAEIAGRVNSFGTDKALSTSFDRDLRLRVFPPSVLRPRKILRMALAASLLIAGLAIGYYLNQPAAKSEMAWGDVISAMQQIERFHVTMFYDPSATQEIYHLDLYYQRPDLWRSEGMNYVQFGADADAKLYSIDQGKFVHPTSGIVRLIPENLADEVKRKDLLSAVLATLFNPHKPPTANVVNDPALGEAGIAVFDYGDKTTSLSARVWVLERSRLPLRLQVSDPKIGIVTWAMVDYSDVRPTDFFDAQAFLRERQAVQEARVNKIGDDIDAWYRLAAAWKQAPSVLKYSENPIDAPAGGFNGYYDEGKLRVRGGSFNFNAVDRLVRFNGKGERVLTEVDVTMLFVHERVSANGDKRLIQVWGPQFDGSVLNLAVDQYRDIGNIQESRVGVDMAGICGPGEIRLFAGQPDEKDPARFSIPFEARKSKGWIDGVFKDGKVRLSVRPNIY